MWEQYDCQTTEQLVKERTKHVHIRAVIVKEYREERKILIKSVKSEENDAGINAQNTLSSIDSLRKISMLSFLTF